MFVINEKVIGSLCIVLATLWTLGRSAESQRPLATSGTESKTEPEKRFYSWEGKRYDDSKQVDKRKFYQWAGKRSENEADPKSGGGESILDQDPQDQDQDVNKRKFYQWAGKRKFYAWAGKRDTPNDDSNENMVDAQAEGPMEKRKFYQWAGKRDEASSTNDEIDVNNLDKRKFYAWAGKRMSNNKNASDNQNNDQAAEKRKFYAWAGRK